MTRKLSENPEVYRMQAEICSALSHPVRLMILDLLSDGEKTNSELNEVLEIPKPNLTQHLNVLRDAGIIKHRKEGLYHYISLAIPQVKDACSMIRGILFEKISEHNRFTKALQKELSSKR